jgi:substrate-binding family protein
MGALAASFLQACSGGGGGRPARGGQAGGGDTIKVGVVSTFSGLGAFIGKITNDSLDAAVQEINATGGIGGRKVELVKRDAGQEVTNGVKAYQEFAGDPHVIGVLWCGGLGFEESLQLIRRDGMPVVAVFQDLASSDDLWPKGPYRSIFQVLVPERTGIDLLCRYAARDRGYRRVALLYDSTVSESAKTHYKAGVDHTGLTSVAIESFNVFASEFGPQLQRLKGARPEALFVWGLPTNTAGVVKELDDLGAAYADAPTAKASGGWRPQVIGSPEGTGDRSLAELAGPSARPGTVTAWHVGGLVYLPSFAIRRWMQKYLRRAPSGGEELPADGLATLLRGFQKAQSGDRRRVVEGIETMGRIRFASVEFGFGPRDHLARSPDDLIVVTLERATGPVATNPPYQLGREWHEVFPPGYAGPTQLVRPTLEANRRAHPEVMEEVLRSGWGTQCTKHADGTLGTECKVH